MMTLHQPALLLLLIPVLGALWLWRLPGRLLNPLRTLVYILLIFALAQPVLMRRRGGGTIVVAADRSASLPPGATPRQEGLIRAVQAHRRTDDLLGVVSFATRAAIEHPPQAAAFGGFAVAHDPDASNLSEALHAALALIPPHTAGRILVLGDGRYTGKDPRKAAGVAAARGIAIDYRLLARGTAGDLAIARLEAPQEVRAGEALLATAWIDSPADQPVSYVLRRGSLIVAQGSRQLPRGRSPLVFRDRPAVNGGSVHGYALTVTGSGVDPVIENNTARFLVSTAGDKPLLCVPASPASHLPERLASGGLDVRVCSPEELDSRLEALAGYSGLVLENTRADRIGATALQTIAAWVQHAGAGLLMTGGRNAFGVGGYYRSALEPVLPVSMELRREHRKFSMAIVVVLDRSGSMTMTVAGGKTKMDLANLGAVEVLHLLSDQDEMGVVAVDSQAHVVLKRMPASQMRGQENRILGIQSMGGGIFIYEALKAAAAQLAGTQAGVKHILLFADASDSEEPGGYKALLGTAAAAGITVSVVGLGIATDSDAALLQEIAALGGGRCFFTDDAHEVPRLFAQDTFMVARSTWITNAVAPRFTVALPELSDALPAAAPPLGGYNLCYLKPDATVVALSPDEHEAPLVALNRHGTGRAAVFTGEADGAEAGDFARWSAIGEFHAALARYCAGPLRGGSEGLLTTQTPIPGGMRVTVHIDPQRPELRGLDGLTAEVLRHRAGEAPRAERATLTWRSADALGADLPLAGSETLLATVIEPGGRALGLPPVCLPYSPEFTPDTGQDGAALLAELAEATGGKPVADVAEIWTRLPRGRRPVPLAPYGYLAAALLFLLEIFERRTGWIGARRRRKPSEPAAASPAPAAPSPGVDLTDKTRRDATPEADDAPSPNALPVPPAESPFDRAKRRARERAR
jgi:uncharacterized membrane protein